mmetsp:Transcript_45196/g.105692  ORF Transcript_45196/g.105692 Transcript_45196/m.105692 type:complete len:200 (-) Transcript_45196:1722-2321(-)
MPGPNCHLTVRKLHAVAQVHPVVLDANDLPTLAIQEVIAEPEKAHHRGKKKVAPPKLHGHASLLHLNCIPSMHGLCALKQPIAAVQLRSCLQAMEHHTQLTRHGNRAQFWSTGYRPDVEIHLLLVLDVLNHGRCWSLTDIALHQTCSFGMFVDLLCQRPEVLHNLLLLSMDGFQAHLANLQINTSKHQPREIGLVVSLS